MTVQLSASESDEIETKSMRRVGLGRRQNYEGEGKVESETERRRTVSGAQQ